MHKDDIRKVIGEVVAKRKSWNHPNGKPLRCKPIMEKLIMYYDFKTVLDVGSGGIGHSDVFKKLGKDVHTCDMTPGYNPTYLGNFLNIESLYLSIIELFETDLIYFSSTI